MLLLAGKLRQRLRITDGRIYADATEITGLHSWLTDYGPVACWEVPAFGLLVPFSPSVAR